MAKAKRTKTAKAMNKAKPSKTRARKSSKRANLQQTSDVLTAPVVETNPVVLYDKINLAKTLPAAYGAMPWAIRETRHNGQGMKIRILCHCETRKQATELLRILEASANA